MFIMWIIRIVKISSICPCFDRKQIINLNNWKFGINHFTNHVWTNRSWSRKSVCKYQLPYCKLIVVIGIILEIELFANDWIIFPMNSSWTSINCQQWIELLFNESLMNRKFFKCHLERIEAFCERWNWIIREQLNHFTITWPNTQYEKCWLRTQNINTKMNESAGESFVNKWKNKTDRSQLIHLKIDQNSNILARKKFRLKIFRKWFTH